MSVFKNFAGFFAVLALCGMGFFDTAFGQANPVVVTPASLTFTAQTGGAAPPSQSLAVTTQTPGVTFIATPVIVTGNTNWLIVQHTSSQTPANVTVSVNPTGLAPNDYQGQVAIFGGTGNVVVNVTFKVTPNSPLTAAPSSLNFTYTIGGPAPAQQNINVTASAATQYLAAATTKDNGNWLQLTSPQGTTPGAVTAGIDPAGLVAGDYEGTVTITPGGQVTVPVQVPVTLKVFAAPTLQPNPASLTFNYQIGGTAPPTQTLEVNSSSIQLGFQALSNASWLIVTPGAASTPATLNVSINTALLQTPGTVQGQITLAPFGAPNISVPVTVNVGTTPFLNASPNTLTFRYQAAAAIPQDQQVTVSSTGTALTFTTQVATQDNLNWLRVRTQNPSTSQPLVIGVDPTGLAPATYRGTVTLISQGQVGTPPSISVTLTVTNDPVLILSVPSANFAFQVGKGNPADVPVGVSSSGTQLNYQAAKSDSPWLVLNNPAGVTNGVFTIGVNTTGLTPNTYEGTVTVTVPNSQNTPLTIPVKLVVSNDPLLVLSRGAVTFRLPIGGSIPALENIAVSSTDTAAPITFTTAITTNVGSGWLLSDAGAGGTTTRNVGITVNPFGLSAGTYTGYMDLIAQNVANSPQRINVTMVITPNETLAASAQSLAFTQVQGGSAPADQTLTISAATPIAFTASATTASGGNWLSVDPGTGTTTRQITVRVNGSTLNTGTYNGEIQISSAAASNTLKIPVTLTVSAQRTITLTPAALTFSAAFGSAAPATQTIAVTSTGGPIDFTVGVATEPPGQPWITVNPGNGRTPGTLTVSINHQSLQPGTYRANITVTAPGATNSPRVATVDLTVTGTTIQLTANSLTFAYQVGGALPSGQQVQVTSTGQNVNFTTAVSTTSGGSWLQATPPNGTAPSTINVTVNPQNLSVGEYRGAVTITAPTAANSPRTIDVVFTVTAPTSLPSIREVLHGATFQAAELSAGLIFTIKGANLGPQQGQVFALGQDGKVPTTVAGVRVLMDNIPAPVLFAQAEQINAIVPYAMANRFGARLVIEYFGVRSAPVDVRIGSASPGFFTNPSTGSGQGAFLNQDNSVNSAANPANKGSIVILYATGEGQTNPQGVDGQVNATVFPKPVQNVRVLIGNREAEVLYAGAAPTYVAGLMQLNVVVPADAPSGNVPVVLRIGDQAASPSVATLAIR